MKNLSATLFHKVKLYILSHKVIISLLLLSKLIFIMSLNIHSNGHAVLCEVHCLIRVIQSMSVLLRGTFK